MDDLLKNAERLCEEYRFREATDLLREALIDSPENPALWRGLAAACRGAEGIRRQIEVLEKALKDGIASFGICYDLGVARAILNQHKKAQETFARAEGFTEPPPELYNEWGLSLQKTGQYREAAACLEKCVSLNEKFADGWNNLGVNAFLQKNYPGAKEYFLKTLEIRRNHEEALMNLIDTAEILGEIRLQQEMEIRLQHIKSSGEYEE